MFFYLYLYLVDEGCLGQSRAKSICSFLQELNVAVKAKLDMAHTDTVKASIGSCLLPQVTIVVVDFDEKEQPRHSPTVWPYLCARGSESPVVVILSGSMEPGFKRLKWVQDPIRTGEIVVFNIDGREIPIVHRVIKVHERQESGEVDILTKDALTWSDDGPYGSSTPSAVLPDSTSISMVCYWEGLECEGQAAGELGDDLEVENAVVGVGHQLSLAEVDEPGGRQLVPQPTRWQIRRD
ncbi:hypothetical protein ZWY2020_041796 [Hordeum vulgare]|nr:hypothetical protein ZWY2020_041796 [Hordeum vulgare]